MIKIGQLYEVVNDENFASLDIFNGNVLEVTHVEKSSDGNSHALKVLNHENGETVDYKDFSYYWCIFSHEMVYKTKEVKLVEPPMQEFKQLHSDLMLTLEERYNNWIVENIHVYELFCEFAIKALQSGKKKISHWLIVNRLRWEVEIETKGTCYQDKEFKISNDYIAFLARDFMKDHPQYGEVFKIKQMKRV